MEDKPHISETLVHRSETTRVQTRTYDEFVDADEKESADEIVEPRRKRNGTRTANAAASTTAAFDQNLIEVLKTNGKFIPQVVKSWVERYEKDPKPAMIELLTMLFEACGATYHIQGEFLNQTNIDDIVAALVNLITQGRVHDFPILDTKAFRRLEKNIVSFFDNLVSECQNGPLFDQVLFDKFMDYVIALSKTCPRVYRHVASMVGLQMATSFIKAANILAANLQTAQSQLTDEKKTNSHLAESLNKRLSDMHEKITMIENMMLKISTGLFMDRYRDIAPEIRILCTQSLGTWIASYPSLFLEDLYLKYLGWMLNDRNDGVREAVVLVLQNLYDMDANMSFLVLFTQQFKKRMLDLVGDADLSVAVCAISLVKQLLRHKLISDDDLGSLYNLLIDDPPEIRRAMGSLAYDHLIAQKFNNSETCDSSRIHVMRMMKILRKYSGDQVMITYVIDAIWEFMDNAIKDWNCIISILLEDNKNSSTELTDDDVTNLTRVLSSSVKKAVGERIIPYNEFSKQRHTKAQKEMIERNRKDITLVMMKNYPQLMDKYMSDKKKFPSLVEVILHMDLELYSLEKQEQNFKTGVQMIIKAFNKHGDKDPIRSCVKAINFCTTGSQGELQDFAISQLKKLEKDLIYRIKAAIKQVADGGGDDDEYSLSVNLKRLYELNLSRPVPIENLYDDFVMVLKNFRFIGDEGVSFVLLNMYLHVAWSLQTIMNSKVVSEESVSSLVSKRNILFKQLHYFLRIPFKASRRLVSIRVCRILIEAWCCFKKATFESTPLASLGYLPHISTFTSFWKLCVQLVDVSDETEEEGKKEYAEETHRSLLLLVVAKLLAAEAVPKEYLREYLPPDLSCHGASVTEVAKSVINALTENKKDASTAAITRALLSKLSEKTLN